MVRGSIERECGQPRAAYVTGCTGLVVLDNRERLAYGAVDARQRLRSAAEHQFGVLRSIIKSHRGIRPKLAVDRAGDQENAITAVAQRDIRDDRHIASRARSDDCAIRNRELAGEGIVSAEGQRAGTALSQRDRASALRDRAAEGAVGSLVQGQGARPSRASVPK